MATYGILYNHQDLTAIAANVQTSLTDARLTNQERQVANRHWNAGLNAWSTAPVAPLEWQSGDPDTRVVVVSHPQVNIQQLIDLLRAVGTRIPGASYMLAIADDIARPSGGQQPWPPA